MSIQVSEPTKRTIDELIGIIKPTADLIRNKNLTIENAWDNPDIAKIRDTLTSVLSRDGEVERLIVASEEMRRQHDALAATAPLTSETLQQLGLLSAGALLLSGEALARSMRPRAMFVYALKRVWPWLLLIVDVGIEVAKAFGAGPSHPQPAST